MPCAFASLMAVAVFLCSISHTVDWLSHDNWNNNNNRYPQTLPLHAYTSNHWFTVSKPLNYALCTKHGKTWSTSFPSQHTFQPLLTQQSARVNDLLSPARPWHYPLQHYTILGVFHAFSTLLKLIFYQATYIATILQSVYGFSMGFPIQWCHYLILD